MKHLFNYQKYLLKHLDDQKFLENERHLSFDSQHHLYKYDGKIVNNLEHRVNILAKIEQLKISQKLKKQFIAEFLKQEYAILETVTEKYGGAKKYWNCKRTNNDSVLLQEILKKASHLGTKVHQILEKQVLEDRCKILPSHLKACLVEQKLVDPEGLIAGTCDVIGWNTETKRFFVLDWKTSFFTTENIERWKYQPQLWAYCRLFANNFTPKNDFHDVDLIEKYIISINKYTYKAKLVKISDEKWLKK